MFLSTVGWLVAESLGPMPTAERMLAARSIKQRKGSNFVGTQNQVSTLYADKTSSKRSKTMMDNIKQQIRLETVTSLSSNNTFRKVMRTMTASSGLLLLFINPLYCFLSLLKKLSPTLLCCLYCYPTFFSIFPQIPKNGIISEMLIH